MMGLSRLMVEPVVRAALLEDLGRAGDITTEAVVPAGVRARCLVVARDAGVVAGLDFARTAFGLVDSEVVFSVRVADGARVGVGDVIAEIAGPARGILTGERVALNFLGMLSGVASATRGIVDVIAHTKAGVTCTRKTVPGLRFAQKYAVRCGGGRNHRFGLDDAILIKDNHIAMAGGVEGAMAAAKRAAGHLVKVEVEVDSLSQLREAMGFGPDAVLLDNMGLDELREAVGFVAGRAVVEASGRVTPVSAVGIAETGVDLISVGWLTHSVTVLDVGLDFLGVG